MNIVQSLDGPGHLMCQICFEVGLVEDTRWAKSGSRQIWDVCAGDCAEQAGLKQNERGWWIHEHPYRAAP